MGKIRLDKVTFSSFHEAFRNRERKIASVVLSGSIPGASHRIFSVDVPIVRQSAVFEVYSQRAGGFPRRRADNCSQMLDVTWSHNVYLWISSLSDNTLRLAIDVDNPGSTASITSQTINFVVYVFDTPF